jgi:hypothetical protein
MSKPYSLTKDLPSSIGHASLASIVAVLIFAFLRFAKVEHAQWIAIGFPAGLYYGREILDQARNIEEDFMLHWGLSRPDARAKAQGWTHAFFVGWDLDGILDVVFPWSALLALAVLATIYL